MFRVILNLGRNSVEAMSKEGQIRIEAAQVEGHILINLSDTGPGLPARARARLFEPFSGSVKSGGTGLGLAIARELVDGHGGSLELVRSDAEGTVFQIALPDSSAAANGADATRH